MAVSVRITPFRRYPTRSSGFYRSFRFVFSHVWAGDSRRQSAERIFRVSLVPEKERNDAGKRCAVSTDKYISGLNLFFRRNNKNRIVSIQISLACFGEHVIKYSGILFVIFILEDKVLFFYEILRYPNTTYFYNVKRLCFVWYDM